MNLTRTMIAGMALAALAVALFLMLWFAFGAAGMSQATRLFASLCLPPVIVGGVLIILVMANRARSDATTKND